MFLKKAIQKETRFSHIVPIAIGINTSEMPFLSSIILWFYVLKNNCIQRVNFSKFGICVLQKTIDLTSYYFL